jgi:hypothetical protein
VKTLARLAAILALVALAGCSATRLVYHNADLFLRWQATSWFDFHGEQSEELDRRIAAFTAWHRASALPQYERVAEDAARRIERGVTRADLVWGYDAFQAQAREALRAAAVEIAPLLDALAPAQLAHLEQRLADENRKFAREYRAGTPEEARKRRLKRTVERLEEWLGTLSDEQIERVKGYNERAPLTGELRERDRLRRQAEFIAMLRARKAGERLPQGAADWDGGRAPAYAEAARRARDEYQAMLLDLDRAMTPEQRRAVAARFRAWAADFQALARR